MGTQLWVGVCVLPGSRCLWWKLHHQCEWMVFLFRIYLIVYLSSLLNSTSYKVLTVRIQVLIRRVMSFTWTGFELTEYNVLGHCTGRGLNHKWDGENETKDWTVSADFFCSLSPRFHLKTPNKTKSLNHTCSVCAVIILTNENFTRKFSKMEKG